MTRGQRISLLRRLHRWLGWAAALLVLVVAVTGILLHHPSWLGTPPVRPLALAVDPTDPDRLLRGTAWGVEVSGDGGDTWREAPMLVPPADVMRIRFGTGGDAAGRVLALGPRAAVRAEDGGRIWSEVSLPPTVRDGAARLIDGDFATDGSLVLLASDGLHRQGPDGNWGTVSAAAPGPDRYRFVHDLHTGQVAGPLGRRIVEYGAWGLVLLTGTGLGLALRRRGRS